MDTNNDEIRRHLAETQRQHEASRKTVASAVVQAFDPETGTSPEAKAALLGTPSRRGFLTVGGLVLSSAAIAACVNPKGKSELPVTGTLPATTTTMKDASPASPELDATTIQTALSLEYLAVDTYQAALDKGYLTGVVADVAKYFIEQHQDHAGALNNAARDLGLTPYDKANPFLQTTVIDPALKAIEPLQSEAERQQATVKLAMSLEDIAAQTYTEAGGTLSTKTLRQAAMSIGAIEARHYTVLAWTAGQPEVPFAFGHTNNAAPSDALVKVGRGETTGTTTK